MFRAIALGVVLGVLFLAAGIAARQWQLSTDDPVDHVDIAVGWP